MEPAIPGTLLADRYLLVRPLGTGGSATVWEAVDTVHERPVAVKLLRGAAVNDPTERERLRREARVLARLAHPRICAIRDYLESPRPDGSSVPVLVTELLTGTSLARRLKEGPLPWAQAVHVCAQIADALLAAHHAGVVHRDVKPANVMLVPDGAKLLDFGIARGRGDGDLTGNLTVGTPLCMAPEQVRGQRARPASDIYALGCVLFWSLTGRPPYQSNDITEVFEAQLYDPPPPIEVAGLPARVIDFCHACLSKNPAFRPNAAQALTTLSGLAAAAGYGALPPALPPAQSPVPPPGRAAAFDGRVRPRGQAQPPGGADEDAEHQRRGARPVVLGVATLLGLSAVTALAVALTGSHPDTGAVKAGPGPAVHPPAAAASASPTISAAGADPVRYLEAVRAQIRVFIADGPATLDATTGGDLQNSITDIENSVISAQRNGGAAHLREIREKIAKFDGRLNQLVGRERISATAANQLTVEVQRLSSTVTD